MQVSLRYQEQTTIDLPVESVFWGHAASKRTGTADVRLPRESSGFDPAYVRSKGGSFLSTHHPTLGRWSGVIKGRSWTPDGWVLKASDLSEYLMVRTVGVRRFESVTAGAIIRSAFIDAIGGLSLGGFSLGAVVESAPVIPEYEFKQQSFGSVIQDLMGLTNQEWTLSPEGVFSWLPFAGDYYPTVLLEGRDLINSSGEVSISEQAVEISSAMSDGGIFRQFAPEVASEFSWPAVKILSGGNADPTVNARDALMVLERSRYPREAISVQLTEEHWAGLREGDLATVVLPSADFYGATYYVRVLSRTYREDATALDVELEILPPIMTSTITTAQSERVIPKLRLPVSREADPVQPIIEQTKQEQTVTSVAREQGTAAVANYNNLTLTGTTKVEAMESTGAAVQMSGRWHFDQADIDQFYSQGTLKVAQLPEEDGSVTLFTCFEMERTRFGMLIPVDETEWYLPHGERWARFIDRLDERFVRWTQAPYHAIRVDSSDASGRALILADVRDGVSYQMPRFGEGLRRWDD